MDDKNVKIFSHWKSFNPQQKAFKACRCFVTYRFLLCPAHRQSKTIPCNFIFLLYSFVSLPDACLVFVLGWWWYVALKEKFY